jgi:hypothetical protein
MSGMPLNTGSLSKLLWPGINKIWGESYAQYKDEYPEIFRKYTSDRNWEEDVGMSGFTLLSVKGEGAPITYDTMKQGFTTRYIHVVYASGFQITREAHEDKMYKIESDKKARALAKAEKQTRETIGANVINRAFNTSYLGGDAKALCVTDHPNVAGGTYSNVLATPALLSEASMEDITTAIWALNDDRGLKAALKPRKLLIPASLSFDADRLFGSPYRLGSANSELNTMKGLLPEGYVVNHWLTSSTAYFVLTDAEDGLKYFERRAPEFKAADNDFETENAKFKVSARYSFGWTDPRSIYGTSGV